MCVSVFFVALLLLCTTIYYILHADTKREVEDDCLHDLCSLSVLEDSDTFYDAIKFVRLARLAIFRERRTSRYECCWTGYSIIDCVERFSY